MDHAHAPVHRPRSTATATATVGADSDPAPYAPGKDALSPLAYIVEHGHCPPDSGACSAAAELIGYLAGQAHVHRPLMRGAFRRWMSHMGFADRYFESFDAGFRSGQDEPLTEAECAELDAQSAPLIEAQV